MRVEHIQHHLKLEHGPNNKVDISTFFLLWYNFYMKRNEVDRSKLSPMMLQYMDVKDKYDDVILFFRLGDFYEMFFEDATLVSHELELTLTGKSAGLDERIPMCGVPHHSASIYIDKLINLGYKVAICEQVEDPKDAKGVVKREVLQVISKGTIMNTDSLDEKSNNYIFFFCIIKIKFLVKKFFINPR